MFEVQVHSQPCWSSAIGQIRSSSSLTILSVFGREGSELGLPTLHCCYLGVLKEGQLLQLSKLHSNWQFHFVRFCQKISETDQSRIDLVVALPHCLAVEAHLVDLVGQMVGHLVPGGGFLAAGSMVGAGGRGGRHPV